MTASLERQLARRRIARRVDSVLPLELSKETGRLSVTPAPIGKYGLWHVKGMQFPPYFQNVRNALMRNGHSVAEASQITWAAIRRWSRGQKTGGEKGKIHPEVVAAARKALAGIAKDQARAHAQRAEHAHANLSDQLLLREFARSGRVLELADPYHNAQGKFTSAGMQGSAQPKGPTPGRKGKTQPPQHTVSPKQRAAYLKQAAADHAKAQMLRQEAAKINRQIAALAALISVEQKFLATASTGQTAAGAGTQTAAGAGTTPTQAAAGTQTQTAAATAQTNQLYNATGGFNPTTTKQMLAQNQAQLKQLTAKRDQLVHQANVLDQQAQNLTTLANG